MKFQPISLDLKDRLVPHYHAFSGRSCQHSFVSSYCMAGKYGDEVCLEDGFLFTHRSLRSTDSERIYLFPLGDMTEEAAVCRAVEKVLLDAHDHHARVTFRTVTEEAAKILQTHFADVFLTEEVRDYAEYIYTHDKLALLAGHEMAHKRYDLHTFERDYAGRYTVSVIQTPEQIGEILPFQEWWMEEKTEHEEDVQLEREDESIRLGLAHFFELGLSGIIVYVDGKMAGYAYGAPLSEDSYDVMIEKGNREIPDIYKVLNRDLVLFCCKEYAYINREEDLGVEGLRTAKLSYKPDILLRKFIAREKETYE
ncbi:MAG: DUF2156 domain-containing protein [Lachnospiraceae bacterium]|nr:DUF2156 domain-containing protein [Lachnospiraceae bacterium]